MLANTRGSTFREGEEPAARVPKRNYYREYLDAASAKLESDRTISLLNGWYFAKEPPKRFCEISVTAATYTVRTGKVGTPGKTVTKTLESDAKALKKALSELQGKLSDYQEPELRDRFAALDDDPLLEKQTAHAAQGRQIHVRPGRRVG